MGRPAEYLSGIEWADPATGLVVASNALSAGIHGQVPGIRVNGREPSFGPWIEGRRLDTDTPVRAFFMNNSAGQPIVGVHEVPQPPEVN